MQRGTVCGARGGRDSGSEKLKMKSEKLKSILKGLWAFCSYVFVPQWGGERRFMNNGL